MIIVGVSGSLRKGSFNTAALRAARELAPEGVAIEIADLSEIPLYNDDVFAQGFPPAVDRLRQQIRAADALLFACPEYNYSLTGVLKNAIDWASRQPDQPFAGKPAALMGASRGPTGTARAQANLRQIGVFVDLKFVNKPEVMMGVAQDRFDAEGKLIHEPTRENIRKLLVALVEWAALLRR
jgi:chromate reductase, NAD(P)H dehydrogenase (quinone)